jgi:DNA-binding response OmpR family regulator
MRICIIDDNVMVLEALALVLRDGGHDVVSAENAMDGMALVERTNPDVVLVDLDLPGMKGDTLAGELRMRHSALPIVLTSGNTSPPAGAIGPHAADLFLAKPFTPGILVATFLRVRALRGEAA